MAAKTDRIIMKDIVGECKARSSHSNKFLNKKGGSSHELLLRYDLFELILIITESYLG